MAVSTCQRHHQRRHFFRQGIFKLSRFRKQYFFNTCHLFGLLGNGCSSIASNQNMHSAQFLRSSDRMQSGWIQGVIVVFSDNQNCHGASPLDHFGFIFQFGNQFSNGFHFHASTATFRFSHFLHAKTRRNIHAQVSRRSFGQWLFLRLHNVR